MGRLALTVALLGALAAIWPSPPTARAQQPAPTASGQAAGEEVIAGGQRDGDEPLPQPVGEPQGSPGAALGEPGAEPPAKPLPPGGEPVLQDRILAVVDDDPILASDVERALALGLYTPPAEPLSGERLRFYVLDGLIDERLRFHEVDRFGFGQVGVDQIEQAVAEIRRRFPDRQSFQEELTRMGLGEQGLRLLVTRQLLILDYVDERLGARIFVSLDDIRQFYDEELVPAVGAEAPPIESVREQIRSILRERRLVDEIARWTEELRSQADVVVHRERRTELPPVIQRLQP
jgi:hypothetical protein